MGKKKSKNSPAAQLKKNIKATREKNSNGVCDSAYITNKTNEHRISFPELPEKKMDFNKAQPLVYKYEFTLIIANGVQKSTSAYYAKIVQSLTSFNKSQVILSDKDSLAEQAFSRNKNINVIVISHNNRVIADFFNAAIEMAEGQYISFLLKQELLDTNFYTNSFLIAKKYTLDMVKANYVDNRNLTRSVIFDNLELNNKSVNVSSNNCILKFEAEIYSGIYSNYFLKSHSIIFSNFCSLSIMATVFWYKTLLVCSAVMFLPLSPILYKVNLIEIIPETIADDLKKLTGCIRLFCLYNNLDPSYVRKVINFRLFYQLSQYIKEIKNYENYENYLFTLSKYFRKSLQNSEMDMELFSSTAKENCLALISSPTKFLNDYLLSELKRKNKDMDALKKRISRIENENRKLTAKCLDLDSKYKHEKQEYEICKRSISYKVGRKITYPLRKLRATMWIHEEKLEHNMADLSLNLMPFEHCDEKNIVYISDDNYAIHTAVSIQSLICNVSKNVYYNIYVIAHNICEEKKRKILSMFTNNVRIFIEDNNSCLLHGEKGSQKIPASLHVSEAALHKFELPHIFDNLDKILYLDCDIIVRSDLSGLFKSPIDDLYAAVVKDMRPMVTYYPTQVEKLSIAHSAYFNSGVMLLNLHKMRQDNISDSLISYRSNGINFFMDQDALNVVFQEKVYYVSFLHNVIYTNIKAYDINLINSYYELEKEYTTKADLLNDAIILHLASKEKPWVYDIGYLTEQYYTYYKKSPFKNQRYFLEHTNITEEMPLSSEELRNGLNTQPRENRIIISLTTIPSRINVLYRVIESLLIQSYKPDAIILYLSTEQFQGVKLPKQLEALQEYGLEIEFCDDLKCHKKYYYTALNYPEDIMITVDDDVTYNVDFVETLMNSYKKYPFAVSAMRTHLITLNDDGQLQPYRLWKYDYRKIVLKPSMRLFPTGIAGVLYPPHALHSEFSNKEQIIKLCLFADDIWLRVMAILNNYPVVLASSKQHFKEIEGTQEHALWKHNVKQHNNDQQFKDVLDKYNEYFGKEDTLLSRILKDPIT